MNENSWPIMFGTEVCITRGALLEMIDEDIYTNYSIVILRKEEENFCVRFDEPQLPLKLIQGREEWEKLGDKNCSVLEYKIK